MAYLLRAPSALFTRASARECATIRAQHPTLFAYPTAPGNRRCSRISDRAEHRNGIPTASQRHSNIRPAITSQPSHPSESAESSRLISHDTWTSCFGFGVLTCGHQPVRGVDARRMQPIAPNFCVKWRATPRLQILTFQSLLWFKNEEYLPCCMPC